MTRTIAAAIFALLAVTSPARAAYVDTLSLEFGSDAEFIGTVTFNSSYTSITAASGTLTGPGLTSPYSPTPAFLSLASPCCALYPGAPGPYYYQVILSGTGPLGGPEDFVAFVYSIKNGAPVLFGANDGVASWDVSVFGIDRSIGGSLTSVSPTPLPAALRCLAAPC